MATTTRNSRSPPADLHYQRQGAAGTDYPMCFPGADIVELYSHRWEIELGYREMKHRLQQHRLTRRSEKATGRR